MPNIRILHAVLRILWTHRLPLLHLDVLTVLENLTHSAYYAPEHSVRLVIKASNVALFLGVPKKITIFLSREHHNLWVPGALRNARPHNTFIQKDLSSLAIRWAPTLSCNFLHGSDRTLAGTGLTSFGEVWSSFLSPNETPAKSATF